MTAFLINDDEWDLLFDEPSDLLKVYCALRRVMDFKTGVSGFSYRINEGFFIDLMDIALIPGRHRPEKFTRGKIRNHLNRLEKIGLMKRRSDIGPFVFELLLSESDKSVQNRMSRGTTKAETEKKEEQRPEKNKENQSSYESSATNNKTEDETPTPDRMNPPPVSGYIDKYTTMQQLYEVLGTVMPVNWINRTDSRKVLSEWLSIGISSDLLSEAIGRAMNVQDGKSFGVKYLDPIVRQLKQKSLNPEKSNGPDKSVRKSSAEKNQEAADAYLRSVGIGEPEDSGSGGRIIDGEVVGRVS